MHHRPATTTPLDSTESLQLTLLQVCVHLHVVLVAGASRCSLTLSVVRGGVEKHRWHFSRLIPLSGRILGRPLPNPCCLMGRRVRRTATPRQRVGGVHRRPPRTLPSKGCGREWATGSGEAVLPPGARPQAAGTDSHARRRWIPPPARGGEVGEVLGAYVFVD